MRLSGFGLVCVAALCGCPAGSGPAGDPGPAGPTGPTGATGATGAMGAMGAAGLPGATGMTGAAGLPGATGARGPEGPAGAQGPAGATGPQGPVGPPGSVLVLDGGVVTGPPGASVVVGTLTPGVECATGGVRLTQLSDGGVTVVCNGAPGLPPSVRALPTMSPQCLTGGVLFGTPDGGSVAVCNGTQGPAGASGAIGAVGPAGPAGIAGPVGPMGAAGAQGSAGPPGAVGPAGPAGIVGPAGPPGALGPAGPAGIVGATGPVGPVGPAGSVLFLDGGVAVVSEVPVQFVGFTVATYTGNLGGLPGAATKCSAEFPNSHLCTIADYDNANTTGVPPTAAGAWVDFARADDGTRSTGACAGSSSPWTNAASPLQTFGATLASTGYAGTTLCSNARHLACCRGGRPSTFRGFTTATFTGNLGGIPGANAKCQVDFPNSWLCSLNEYDLANTQVVPTTTAGAWVDGNRAANGTRSTGACAGGSSPWTNAATPFQTFGITLTAKGYAGENLCSNQRQLACCSR